MVERVADDADGGETDSLLSASAIIRKEQAIQPQLITIKLISIFPLILWRTNPMQIPKIYGESLAHGFSYTPLKNAKFSWMIKLTKENISWKSSSKREWMNYLELIFIPCPWKLTVVIATIEQIKNELKITIPNRGWLDDISRITLATMKHWTSTDSTQDHNMHYEGKS